MASRKKSNKEEVVRVGNRYGKPLSFDERVDAITLGVANMLKEKNHSYGNSALDPVRIFSKATPVEQILVRLDDKLSRLKRGDNRFQEDTILDLLGYLVLLLIAKHKEN